MSSKTHSKKARSGRSGKRPTPRQRLINRVGLVAVVAFVAFALHVLFTTPPDPSNTRRQPDRVGEPWEYDARFDMYWDPRPGHEHWHEGRPPAPDEQ